MSLSSRLASVRTSIVATLSSSARPAARISEAERGPAVEQFGAKNDPSFKDILARIASTLSSSLG